MKNTSTSIYTGLAVYICLASMSGFAISCAADDTEPLQVVISTDNSAGIKVEPDNPAGAPFDDFLAIMQALNEPGVEVRGVIPMFGNYRARTAVYTTRFLLDTKMPEDRDRLLFDEGADFPIGLEYLQPEQPDPSQPKFGAFPKDFCVRPGTLALKEHLASRRATILAIGPLTDIACLLVNWPDLASQIDRVVFLGGRYDKDPTLFFENTDAHGKKYKQPLPDANYNNDTVAASIVLRSGVPFTSVPGTLAQLVRADFGKIADHDTTLSRWIAAAAFARNDGFRDVVPWDSVALNSLVIPEEYVCAPAGFEVIDCATRKCAGHDLDDKLHFLVDEVKQVWFGPDLPHDGERVRICYKFVEGGQDAVARRIEKFSF